jgi:hypothetical protein
MAQNLKVRSQNLMISNQLKRHLGQKDIKEHNYIRMITET